MSAVLVTLNCASNLDDWLRAQIRGTVGSVPEPPKQYVLVETIEEARRICNRMAQLKYARVRPWGGASHQLLRYSPLASVLQCGHTPRP